MNINKLLKGAITFFAFLFCIQAAQSQVFEELTGIGVTEVYNGSTHWADFDNDGLLDILLTGYSSGSSVAKIYKNNGNSTFTEQLDASLLALDGPACAVGDYDNDGLVDILMTGNTGMMDYATRLYKNIGSNNFIEQSNDALTGVNSGALDWGDYDNDGDLDILLAGNLSTSRISKVYRNNSDGTFTEQEEISLSGIWKGVAEWVDYDNDGLLDIFLCGNTGSSPRIAKIYKNNGDNSFSDQTLIAITGVDDCSADWGDYDSDGDVDLLLAGYTGSGRLSRIYRNNGDNTFSAQTGISLTGVDDCSVKWGDHDNDGDLDILLTGYDGSSRISLLYRNNGNNTFTSLSTSLTGVAYSSVAWGDFDNDMDLDVLLTGRSPSSTYSTKIFKNLSTLANSLPSAPDNLESSVDGEEVTFTWDKSTDTETAQNSLSYNLYVSNISNEETVKPVSSELTTGFRKIVRMGNSSLRNSYTLKTAPGGQTIYWGVQSIDNAFAGSPFSAEQSLEIVTVRPLVNATNILSSEISDASATINWDNGDGYYRAVFIKQGSVTPFPEIPDSTSYIANAEFGSGSELGLSGWYCVYNSTGSSVVVTGLQAGAFYNVKVVEYNGAGGTELYFSDPAENNPAILYTTYFEEEESTLLPGVAYSTSSCGDYDNDGDLDLLITGYSASALISKIYANNGDFTFTEQTGISLPEVYYGSSTWGDYNNDGHLDFLLTGTTDLSNHISGIYKNNGDNTFTEQGEIILPPVYHSSVDWGDMDNDGDLDILLTGAGTSRMTKIYRNEGNDPVGFSELTGLNLAQVVNGSVAWGDCDNDGDLDILLTGYTGSDHVSKLYKNLGSGNFEEALVPSLQGVSKSSVAWGDYDNDGDLDLLLSGYTGTNRITKIYKNLGGDNFSEVPGTPMLGLESSSVAWGDFDNDGDVDLLINGLNGSTPISKIYVNLGDDEFTEYLGNSFTGLESGSSIWADFNNDGNLDILQTGRNGSDRMIKVYRNNSQINNVEPGIPDNLQSSINNSEVTLTWNKSSDDLTPQNSLSYNIYISNQSDNEDVKPSMSNLGNGYRKIVMIGNAALNNSYTFKSSGTEKTFYWGVQAVDNSYAGSSFSTEHVFTIEATTPTLQASGIIQTSQSDTSMHIKFTEGNGNRRLVVAKHNASENDSVILINDSTYTPDTKFGNGSQVGSTGWFCVYNGISNEFELTGLTAGAGYSIQVVEYNEVVGSKMYNLVTSVKNPAQLHTFYFKEDTSISLTGVNGSNSSWGDYDGDGDLDILLTGNTGSGFVSEIYKNDIDSFSIQSGISLPGINNGSAEWGDYDNDGDLDILLSGAKQNAPYYHLISKIYTNSEGVFQENSDVSFTGIHKGNSNWADYDNNGYLDVLITGESDNGMVTKLYRNVDDTTFIEQSHLPIRRAEDSKTIWADYNNDGLPDFLLIGNSTSVPLSLIYKNTGENYFEPQTSISLTGVANGDAAWGDYDGDGDLDILLTGKYTVPIAKIYRNNGDNSFTEQTDINLTGVEHGAVAWGDYDNDGDLDILLTGSTGSDNIAKVYKNYGNNSFVELPTNLLPGIYNGSVAWGDYDNDNDLDILFTGHTGSAILSKVYENKSEHPNSKPSIPEGLTHAIIGHDVQFSWDTCNDAQTVSPGLSYNLYVADQTSLQNRKTAMANISSGYQHLVKSGNIVSNTYTMMSLPGGQTYYWSVQSIDNSFSGSEFAPEQSFLKPVVRPDQQASGLQQIGRTASTVQLKWTNGNGYKRLVFVQEINTGDPELADNVTHIPNTQFGLGSLIGTSGWYCVYNGYDTLVTVTGLQAGTKYRSLVVEYDGVPGTEQYNSDTTKGNMIPVETTFFEIQNGISFTGTTGSSVWGDYDNDNDLDVLVIGRKDHYTNGQFAALYKNNGDDFTLQTGLSLIQVEDGAAAWGDYNNDGNVDFILTGETENDTAITALYKNNGDSTFTNQTEIQLTGVRNSSVDWGDYNNDGYLDILLTGYSGSTQMGADYFLTTKIYKNNGGNSFSELENTSLTSIQGGAAIWGDYDNDGDLDIFMTGDEGDHTYISKLYKNNGNDTFEEVTGNAFLNMSRSYAEWGDYDNDGDLDILVSGLDIESKYHVKIYKNNGDDSFSESSYIQAGASAKGYWGDYDSDGLLDIMLTNPFLVYQNKGDDIFIQQDCFSPGAETVENAVWVDYDNDSDLDVFINGTIPTTVIATKLFRNLSSAKNTNPLSPTNLQSSVRGNSAILSWSKATDAETSQDGLSYNVYVSEISRAGDQEYMGELIKLGNAGKNDFYTIENLEFNKTYYWSVQTIDNGFARSPYAIENSFETYEMTDQVIVFDTIEEKAFSDSIFTLTAIASSGLPVTYSSSNTQVAKIINDSVIMVGVGTTLITASQAGNNIYNPAPEISRELTIVKGEQFIIFDEISARKADDEPFALTASTSSGLPVSFSSSDEGVVTISDDIVTIIGPGISQITASQSGNELYHPASNVTQTLTVTEVNSTFTLFADNIQIYPNPVSDMIYIKSQETIEGIEIVNITGEKIACIKILQTTVNWMLAI